MRLALVIFGVALVAWPTNFGSEAILLEHWRLGTGADLRLSVLMPDDDAAAEISAAARQDDKPEIHVAALSEPEGPPPPPPDISIDAVCHTLASVAQAYGLPTGFFARLIWQESKFGQRVVSRAGAQGVAQFMPAVAAERGLQNPFDPLAALPHSARFLKEHLQYFGNLGLAAAAYNGGARRVTDWLARRGKLPEETRNYVKIITGHPPETWTQTDEIEMPVNLPQRAPCEGVANLSHGAEAKKIAVQLEPPVAKIIEDVRIAEAKAKAEAEAKARQLAAKKSKRERLLAKGKGGKEKEKTAKAPTKIAEKPAEKRAEKAAKLPPKMTDRPTDKANAKTKVRVAETIARR